METEKKYIVCSGYVYYDGDRHFISSSQLIRLHNVNRQECIIVDSGKNYKLLDTIETHKMIHLFPRNDGKYKNYGGKK